MAVDVLFFGAHPDDVEWSVGGIALLLRDHGVSFGIIDMTEGEMGSRGTVETRRLEAQKASEAMGCSVRENLGLPDHGLVDSPDYRRSVARAVRRHMPRMVVAPLREDRHPDHAAAGLIVQHSRMLCGLHNLDDGCAPHRPKAYLYYPIHTFHSPTFVVNTSAVYERKRDLMLLYDSQFGKANATDFLHRLESRDRYYGSLTGATHGEPLVADQPIALDGLKHLLGLMG
jgi:bacillithiol biosynthesis deacetylase BshB1